MNEKEKINEIKLNFFDAVLQLIEEACNEINAIYEDVDSVKEGEIKIKPIRLYKGFYKNLWSMIEQYIGPSTAISAEEIMKLCWKFAPIETKESLESYKISARYSPTQESRSFKAYLVTKFMANDLIKSLRNGFYVRSDLIHTPGKGRRSVNNTTSNVVINNSPVIKVINK